MHIDIQKFLDSTLVGYVIAGWLGLLTFSTSSGPLFLILVVGLITAYGLGKSVSYPPAVNEDW